MRDKVAKAQRDKVISKIKNFVPLRLCAFVPALKEINYGKIDIS
jgi:hypothetical protein